MKTTWSFLIINMITMTILQNPALGQVQEDKAVLQGYVERLGKLFPQELNLDGYVAGKSDEECKVRVSPGHISRIFGVAIDADYDQLAGLYVNMSNSQINQKPISLSITPNKILVEVNEDNAGGLLPLKVKRTIEITKDDQRRITTYTVKSKVLVTKQLSCEVNYDYRPHDQ